MLRRVYVSGPERRTIVLDSRCGNCEAATARDWLYCPFCGAHWTVLEPTMKATRVFYFHLDRVRSTPERQLALAAQSEPTQWVYHASLRTDVGEIEGELRYELMRDTLLFFIERLEGFEMEMQLVVQTKGEEIESPRFVPRVGEEVEVAAILLPQVEKIAARIG